MCYHGKNIPDVDAISRISSCHDEAIQGLDESVNKIHVNLNASPTRVGQILEETAKDPTVSPALSEVDSLRRDLIVLPIFMLTGIIVLRGP